MWRDRRLLDLFGIAHPILQAPMAGAATPDLAAAVTQAGGLGALGCAEAPPDQVADWVADLRRQTGGAFNLNFFVHPAPVTGPDWLAESRARLAPWYAQAGLGAVPTGLAPQGPGFGPERLAMVLRLRPRVVSFHFGSPGASAMQALKAAGIVVIGTATRVAEAKALEAADFDAVIAQGFDAGGHRGSHGKTAAQDGVGTLALVPQVVDAVSLPVIAAGGITDGRGIAAALMLGAAGVQMGTAFLRCPEAATPAARRAALARARDDDTMMTDAFSGRAARARRSAFAEAMAGRALADFPQSYDLAWPLVEAGAASFDLWGQAAALAREAPAGEVVAGLVAQTMALMQGRGG